MQRNFTLSFFTLLLAVSFSFGQAKLVDDYPTKQAQRTHLKIKVTTNARSMVSDTIVPPIFAEDECSLQLFGFLNSAGWGFVGGQNEFGDLEKAQRFYYDASNYTVDEVFIYIASAEVVGDGNVFAKIYEVDETSNGPGVLVGTSDPVKASDLNIAETSVVPTLFRFSDKPQVSGNQFFVSVDFRASYQAQDTVSLWMTDIECGMPNEAWELFVDGETWVAMSDSASWFINSNLFMIAVVESDGVSATKELLVGNQTITLQDAFPNPANESLNVNFELEKSTAVQLGIYSLTGQQLQLLDWQTLPAGLHQQRLSISELPNGTYLYGLVTDKGRLMNKFTVAR